LSCLHLKRWQQGSWWFVASACLASDGAAGAAATARAGAAALAAGGGAGAARNRAAGRAATGGAGAARAATGRALARSRGGAALACRGAGVLLGGGVEARHVEALADPSGSAELAASPLLLAGLELGADALGFVLQEVLFADGVGDLEPSHAAVEESLLALDVSLEARLGEVCVVRSHLVIPSNGKVIDYPRGPIPGANRLVGMAMSAVK